jgi:hypothetical protein
LLLAKFSRCIIIIAFSSTHNHPCSEENLKFQPFPTSTREDIKMKLAMGIEAKKIFADYKDDKWTRDNRSFDTNLNKNDFVTRRLVTYPKIIFYCYILYYFRYINQRRSEMKAAQHLSSDDATSTALLVEKLAQETYNPVVVFKPFKGDMRFGDDKDLRNHEDYEDLFFDGLQTKEQAVMMEQHAPKIICGDATHGMTAYGFQLFSLVVKDDTGKGFPVAYLITSNVTKLILTCFFSSIQRRIPRLKITLTMSDDDIATKQAFRAAFGEDIMTLLCQWHVPLAWTRNVWRIDVSDKKEELLYLLRRAMKTRDKTEYHSIVTLIRNDYSDCKRFVDYLDLNYFNRPDEWSSCFRTMYHDSVDTNMLLESFHNLLKTVELSRRPNRRVDTLIELLLDMEENRFREYLVQKSKKMDPPLVGPTTRHQKGLRIPDSSVLKLDQQSWKVESTSRPHKWHDISKVSDFCFSSHCYLACPATPCDGLCAHLYRCDCEDADPLCKHIHKVHSREMKTIIQQVNYF